MVRCRERRLFIAGVRNKRLEITFTAQIMVGRTARRCPKDAGKSRNNPAGFAGDRRGDPNPAGHRAKLKLDVDQERLSQHPDDTNRIISEVHQSPGSRPAIDVKAKPSKSVIDNIAGNRLRDARSSQSVWPGKNMQTDCQRLLADSVRW